MNEFSRARLEGDAGGDTPPRLALRPRQAAAALGISPRLLWQLTHAGQVPHARLGKAIVYPVAQLQEWLALESAREGRE